MVSGYLFRYFLFSLKGDGERDDDISEKYGGVVYIYNDVSIAVTSPNRNNHYDSGYAIFTGKQFDKSLAIW